MAAPAMANETDCNSGRLPAAPTWPATNTTPTTAPVPAPTPTCSRCCANPLPLPPVWPGVPGAPAAFPVAALPWTGAFIGVGFSLFDQNVHQSENGPGVWPAAYGERYSEQFSLRGTRIGLFGGYNHQTGRVVLGIEADVGKTLGGTSNRDGVYPGADVFSTLWDASIRARLGYAASDNVMFYGTAGPTVARARTGLDNSSDSNTHMGWTAGLGSDFNLIGSLFGRVEARYSNYSDETYRTAHGPIAMGWDDKRVTFGLAYRF